MKFELAYKLMKSGEKIKLPSWGGYWYWDTDKETIIIHTKDGEEFDIRETTMFDYTMNNILSDEWLAANNANCPEIGGIVTFSFSEAIKQLKKGRRVSRLGWNGKNQYIELGREITYHTLNGTTETCFHRDIDSQAIVFVGTPGRQMGWLASQSDMLAEDWTFAG